MSDLLLPSGGRLIHLGPHKTGSTAIQVALHEARDALAADGAHYGGKLRRSRKAGWAIGLRGRPVGSEQPPMLHWEELVADVSSAGDRRVCISNEDFARAEPEQIKRIVDDLGGDEPHVVLVARRLDRLLRSQWQERVKAGIDNTYDDWLRIVLADPGSEATWDRSAPGYHFERTDVWFAHDIRRLVRRWADVVGSDRITVIATDDSDPQLLPRTFEQMLGLTEGVLELYPDRSNRSLDWGEIEFIRAVNQRQIERGVPRPIRRRLIAIGVVNALRALPVQEGQRRSLPLPEWAADVLRKHRVVDAAAFDELGVRVVGDPACLQIPDSAVGDLDDPPPIPPGTAACAIDWLVEELMPNEAEPSRPSAQDYEPVPGNRRAADRIPHEIRAMVPPPVRRGLRKALRRTR